MRNPVWDQEIGDNVAKLLFETNSYLVDFERQRKDWYKWKSGIVAPCYCNCRYLNRSYSAYQACADYLGTIIRIKFPDVQLIVGLASAGVVWSSRIATNLGLPMAFVRGEPKFYGVGRLVEGNPQRGSRVVIVDDLCGSGETILKAIKALEQEYEIKTEGFVTIVNWSFETMWERFKSLKTAVYSLTSYPNILKVGVKMGHLTEDQAGMLAEFYKDHQNYVW